MSSPVQDQNPATPSGQPGTIPPTSKGPALAIAALVVAIVSLLLCLVPIINNVVFLLALISLVIGFVAWRGASKGRRSGKGMALSSIIISIVALAGVIASQAFYSNVLDSASKQLDPKTTASGSASAPTSGARPSSAKPSAFSVGDTVTIKTMMSRPAR